MNDQSLNAANNRISELEAEVYRLKLLLELANALNTKEPHVIITSGDVKLAKIIEPQEQDE